MNAFQKVLIIFVIMVVAIMIASAFIGDDKIVQFQRDFLSNTELNYIMPQQKVEYNYKKIQYYVEKTKGVKPDPKLEYSNHKLIHDTIAISFSVPKDFKLNDDEKSLVNGKKYIYTYVEPIPEKYDYTYTYDALVKDYLETKYTNENKRMIEGNITLSSLFDEESNTTYYYYILDLNDKTHNYFFITTYGDNNLVTIQYKVDANENVNIEEIETIFLSSSISAETE